MSLLHVGCSNKDMTSKTKVQNNCKYINISAIAVVKEKRGQKLTYLAIDRKYFADDKEQRYLFGIIPDLKDKRVHSTHKVGLDLLVSGNCEILDVNSIRLISSY